MPNFSRLSQFIKFRLLHRPLELTKTHDFCAKPKPQLTVVLLHGIASSSTTFHQTLRYLEGTTSMQKVRFISYDWLGHGKSYSANTLDYDYDDQLIALHRSLKKLKIKTPLVIVGHSMGTLLATRYAFIHKKTVKKLILVSPPVYTKENLKNPAFKKGMTLFQKTISRQNKALAQSKAFLNSLSHIVQNPANYKIFQNLKTPTVFIYSKLDTIIAPFNIPKLVKLNPKYLSLIKTTGKHHITREKYTKILSILEELTHETL